MSNPSRFIEFPGWKLDLVNEELVSDDGRQVSLANKEFAILKYLVDRPGQLVRRSGLWRAGWGGDVLDENNLDQAIGRLRRAFSSLGLEAMEVIQNVPRKGYKFVPPPTLPKGGPELTPQPSLEDLAKQVPTTSKGAGPTSRAVWLWGRALVLSLFGLSAVLLFFLLDSYVQPYGAIQTSTTASEVEVKAKGLVSVFAPDVHVTKCDTLFGTGHSDWQFDQLVRLKGLVTAKNVIRESSAWDSACQTVEEARIQAVFGTQGNLKRITIPGDITNPIDFASHVEPATEIAERLFAVHLRQTPPRAFSFDGHDYVIGDHHFVGDFGAPYQWSLPPDDRGIKRTIKININGENRLIQAEKFGDPDPIIISDPQTAFLYNGSYWRPWWPSGVRITMLIAIILLVIVKARRLRPTTAAADKKLIPLIAAIALYPAISDISEQSHRLVGEFGSYGLPPLIAEGIGTAIGLSATFALLCFLTSKARTLLVNLFPQSEFLLRSPREWTIDRRMLTREVVSGLCLGFGYLIVHSLVLIFCTKFRFGSWTNLWVTDSSFTTVLLYPVSETIGLLFVLIAFRGAISSKFNSSRAVFLSVLLMWVVGQYTLPDAVGEFGPSVKMTLTFSLLQGIFLAFLVIRGQLLRLVSFMISVATGLVNYAYIRTFFNGNYAIILSAGVLITVLLALLAASIWSHLIGEKRERSHLRQAAS